MYIKSIAGVAGAFNFNMQKQVLSEIIMNLLREPKIRKGGL